MMELITPNPDGKRACIPFACIFLLIFLPFQHILAQEQFSTFSIVGWTPGTVPVYAGSDSNVISLNYGDTLTTTVAFSGSPDDGLGTDNDNVAFMSFSYTYTTYLTKVDDTFSITTSVPVGSHTISAFQACMSGVVTPWTIGYDAQSTTDTNEINMNIADQISDCLAPGDYQVDIVLTSYAENTAGPSPTAIQLVWSAYAGNSSARALTSLSALADTNTNTIPLGPAPSYLLSQIAFIHIAKPTSCPPLTLSLPEKIQTSAFVSSATVSATYPGQCPQNNLTYLWSNGDTAATASGLSRGIYTVTVTTPCGNSASASVTISDISMPEAGDLSAPSAYQDAIRYASETKLENDGNNTSDAKNKLYKNAGNTSTNEAPAQNLHLNLYPNPAKHHITFDIGGESDSHSTIRIFDILGNEVIAPVSCASQKVEVNLDELLSGVYLYELASNKIVRGKFVKQ